MERKFGKVALVLGLLLALTLGGLSPTGLLASKLQGENNDYVPGEVLVKFKPGTPALIIAQVHRENKGTIKEEISGIDVQVIKVQDVPSKVRAYSRNPNVLYAEPNYIAYALAAPDDTYFDNQWALNNTGQTCCNANSDLCITGTSDADIDAPEAWDIATGSSSVKIAILDSGIDQDHEDLASKVVAEKNFSDSGTVDDIYGHGTHVGGIAAAVTNNSLGVAGVGYEASLMNVKVLGDSGSGAYSWVASGIIWATDNGAKTINMSLGGTRKSSTLESAVNYAWTNGVVLAAAAGNSNNPSPTYPARYENCIAVAATDINDQKASFSSYGSWVDVAAPGENIYSTFPNHPFVIQDKYGRANNYDFGSGTSMSTPHVAGLAGLLWATSYGTDNVTVRGRIQTMADAIDGTGSYWIWGRINAARAVGTEEPTPTPTPTPTEEPTPTPTPKPECSDCFKGVCDGHCHPVKDGATCPDCL